MQYTADILDNKALGDIISDGYMLKDELEARGIKFNMGKFVSQAWIACSVCGCICDYIEESISDMQCDLTNAITGTEEDK